MKRIIYRWIDLLALSITGVLICFLLQSQIIKLGIKLEKSLYGWNYWIQIAIGLLLTAVLWFIIGRLGGASFSGFFTKKTICNPPVWFFGVLSFFFYFLKLYKSNSGEYSNGVIAKAMFITLGMFALGGVLASISNFFCEYIGGNRLTKVEKDFENHAPEFDKVFKNPKMLIEWIHKEEPIEKPSQDYFDMAVFARRIAHILKRSPLKTIGLIGRYGCGKSSILNMVKEYLTSSKKLNGDTHAPGSLSFYPSQDIIICWVSGWGFREGTAAQHVLQAATKQLGKHTDCLSITTLPTKYGRAIGDSGNVLARIISNMLCGWQSPIDILKKLDVLLDSIEKRMVIFLEDIDRNKREDVFFNEISALLDGLKELKNVTFVLAIGEEHKGQEVLIKTSEHIETIPNLDRRLLIKMCETFRDHCLSKLDKNVKFNIDGKRDEHTGFKRSKFMEEFAEIDERLEKPIDYVAELLNNPRIAKLSLRRSYQGWEKLCGEIDFDDLFMANVIRSAAPEVFMFINENIASFQYLSSIDENSKDRADKNRDKLQDELKKISEGKEWNYEALNKIIDYLFRGWTEPAHTMYPDMRKSERKYQHIENSWPTDYWARLTREEISPREVRDQEILFALGEWNKDRHSKVFKDMNMRDALISGQEIWDKALQFKERINEETLRDLAKEQFQITLKKEKNKASYENCPAVEKWFLLEPKPPSLDSKEWRDWFYEQIKMALPVSLGYANDLYHFWVDPARYRPIELRSKIVEEAKRIYGGNPEALVKAIDPKRFSVTHFAREYSESKQGGPGFKPEEWQWLGDALLAGAKIKREIIVPQIVLLVGHIDIRLGKRTGKVHSYELSEDLAKGLFGKKIKQLMELIAEDIDLSSYDSDIKVYIQLAQNWAKKWLSDQGDGAVDS